jgi:hypothetical protein
VLSGLGDFFWFGCEDGRADRRTGRPSAVPDAPRRADPDTDVNQLRDNYDKGAAGVFDGTVDVVTGISLEEQRPNMNLDFHFVRTT